MTTMKTCRGSARSPGQICRLCGAAGPGPSYGSRVDEESRLGLGEGGP